MVAGSKVGQDGRGPGAPSRTLLSTRPQPDGPFAAMFPTQHLTPDKIYHVAVMPCHDKKLEASRPDFFSQEHQTRDVDCVITTGDGP